MTLKGQGFFFFWKVFPPPHPLSSSLIKTTTSKSRACLRDPLQSKKSEKAGEQEGKEKKVQGERRLEKITSWLILRRLPLLKFGTAG